MSLESVNIGLFGKMLPELQALAAELGLPKYRAAQVFEGIRRGGLESLD